MNKSILIALAAAFSSAPVYAQDTIDSHGFHPVPTDGDLLDPILLQRGETHEQYSVGIQSLFEYAKEPLVLYSSSAVTSPKVLLQDLTAINLSGFYAPHERISLGVSAPLFLSVDSRGTQAGMGWGDMRLSSSVGILIPQEDEVGIGLSLVPHVIVPGFYGDSFLSTEGISGGGIAAFSVGGEIWDVTTNVGMEFAPDIEFYNLNGGERLLTGLAAGAALTEDIALRTEATFRPSLYGNDYAWADAPAEIAASLRGYNGNNLSWTVGASHALTKGVSAADWRVFAGLNFAFHARQNDDNACLNCGTADIMIVTRTPEGNLVDAPLMITDYNHNYILDATTNQEEAYEFPVGDYIIEVTIPPCNSLISIEGDELILLEPINFDFDEATIRFPDSHAVMSELTQTLIDHPEISRLQVATGTDVRGSSEYNMALSFRRAESVVSFLVEHGISPSRLTSVGYGETRLLIQDCRTDECHEKNRYAEFKILEVEE